MDEQVYQVIGTQDGFFQTQEGQLRAYCNLFCIAPFRGEQSDTNHFKGHITGLVDDYAPSWEVDQNMDNQLDKTYGGCTVAADGNHVINDFGPSIGAPGLVSHGSCSLCHQGLRQILAYDKAHGGETGTYDDYVKQNYPVNGYSPEGFYWYPTIDDVSFVYVYFNCYKGSSRKSVVYKYSSGSWSFDNNSILSGSGRIFGNSLIFSVAFIDPSYTLLEVSRAECCLYIPISGSYSYQGNLFHTTDSGSVFYPVTSSVSYVKGKSMTCARGGDLSTSGSCVVYLPVLKVVPSQEITNSYYVQSSRVGSVNFNLATKQGDTVNNYYPNVQLFNETTNIYTNPSTGQQQNVSSWTYDYSTRTYHLTLEDGSLLDIEFGDGSIKVTLNGELTQEYYYTVEKEEEPGPSPSPDPGPVDPTVTPTPDPGTTPEPSPDPEDPDAPDGFFEWLKQWLIEFKEWLGDWLDKLFNKEPGDITIDESDNSVHINDQDNLDYDIYYTDDSGQERQTSLRDLLHKFDFLRDIYDIGRDLFAIVGADAAAAHAYNSTGTVDITPYLGDLRTVAAADVMPIAGGSGAPSLKMNLGAANSHYGYTYGGEVEILDLSWYTPYKGTVDNLLSGFLWLFFAWRLFKHAPSIVSGAGMVSEKAEDIHDGKRH